MPVSLPTPEQLKRIAEEMNLSLTDSDIASFSNVFNWGAERGWLSVNPAERATIKTKRKKAKLRRTIQVEALRLLPDLLRLLRRLATDSDLPRTVRVRL